jgi:hypothetical protein
MGFSLLYFIKFHELEGSEDATVLVSRLNLPRIPAAMYTPVTVSTGSVNIVSFFK